MRKPPPASCYADDPDQPNDEARMNDKFYEIVRALYGIEAADADDEICEYVADLMDHYISSRDPDDYPENIRDLLQQYMEIWDRWNRKFTAAKPLPSAATKANKPRSLFTSNK